MIPFVNPLSKDLISSRREIRELNDQVVKRTDNLSALLHQNTEVKMRLCTVLSEPWDQKPIYFQDAVGRRYPVPLEAVRNFNVSKARPLFEQKLSL